MSAFECTFSFNVRFGSEADISQGWPENRGLGSAHGQQRTHNLQRKAPFQVRDFLTCLSGSLPYLNLAVKITFAQVESVVSQQVVGGRHMKIEIRQHKAQQIALAGEFHGVTPEF